MSHQDEPQDIIYISDENESGNLENVDVEELKNPYQECEEAADNII